MFSVHKFLGLIFVILSLGCEGVLPTGENLSQSSTNRARFALIPPTTAPASADEACEDAIDAGPLDREKRVGSCIGCITTGGSWDTGVSLGAKSCKCPETTSFQAQAVGIFGDDWYPYTEITLIGKNDWSAHTACREIPFDYFGTAPYNYILTEERLCANGGAKKATCESCFAKDGLFRSSPQGEACIFPNGQTNAEGPVNFDNARYTFGSCTDGENDEGQHAACQACFNQQGYMYLGACRRIGGGGCTSVIHYCYILEGQSYIEPGDTSNPADDTDDATPAPAPTDDTTTDVSTDTDSGETCPSSLGLMRCHFREVDNGDCDGGCRCISGLVNVDWAGPRPATSCVSREDDTKCRASNGVQRTSLGTSCECRTGYTQRTGTSGKFMRCDRSDDSGGGTTGGTTGGGTNGGGTTGGGTTGGGTTGGTTGDGGGSCQSCSASGVTGVLRDATNSSGQEIKCFALNKLGGNWVNLTLGTPNGKYCCGVGTWASNQGAQMDGDKPKWARPDPNCN